MGAAERTAEQRPVVSLDGLLLAARRLRVKFVLLALVPMVLNGAIRFVDQPWLVWAWPGMLLTLTLVLAYRRSVFALLPLYFLLAGVWAELWLRAPDAGMPVQVDYVIDIDRVLGLGRLPTVWLQELHGLPHDRFWELPILATYISFFLAHQAVVFMLFFGRRDLATRYTVAFMLTSYLALAMMVLLPTVPPWMASETGAAPHIARVAYEILRGVDQSAVDAGYDSARINELAAMPSLHMGATVVIAIVAGRVHPRLRPIGLVYCVAMGISLVYLGEHYLIDVTVGAALAIVSWRVTDVVFALPFWRRFSRPAEPSVPDAEPVPEREARAA